MPRGSKNLEIGNLVCKVGLDKVLLDIFADIIWPSMQVSERYRGFGKTKFKFLSVKLISLGMDGETPILGVVGRFVKDTVLVRDQVLSQENELIEDHQELRSSPASLFLLILNTHRLVFVKESRFAPNQSEFRGTFESYVRSGIKDYINSKVAMLPKKAKKVARSRLKEEFIALKVTLSPITCRDSIEEFVDRFHKIQVLRIKTQDTNSEIDNSGLFEGLREQKNRLNSVSTSILHKSKDGLNQDEIKDELEAATCLGNQTIALTGVDCEGNYLAGDSENLAVKKSITDLSHDVEVAGSQMFDHYKGLEESNTIAKPTIGDSILRNINAIIERYF